MAKKAYSQFITAQYCLPVEEFISDVIKMVKDYNIDACIYLAHIGCKHGCASIRMVKEAVQDECEIPFFTLDSDAMDPTVVPAIDMKNKLEGFLEMLDE